MEQLLNISNTILFAARCIVMSSTVSHEYPSLSLGLVLLVAGVDCDAPV